MDAESPSPDTLSAEVYEHLRALAASYFRGAPQNQSLQPTALVHEAWVRLIRSDVAKFKDRAHFVAVAATAMRQILADRARRRVAEKRGGRERERVSLTGLADADAGGSADLVALDAALSRLGELSPRQARVVELRYFGGLTVAEAAAALGVSASTVEQEWRRARAWLRRSLATEAGAGSP